MAAGLVAAALICLTLHSQAAPVDQQAWPLPVAQPDWQQPGPVGPVRLHWRTLVLAVPVAAAAVAGRQPRRVPVALADSTVAVAAVAADASTGSVVELAALAPLVS